MTKFIVEKTSNTTVTKAIGSSTNEEVDEKLKEHVRDDAEPAMSTHPGDDSLEIESMISPESSQSKKQKRKRKRTVVQVKNCSISEDNNDNNYLEEELMSPEERKPKKQRSLTVMQVQSDFMNAKNGDSFSEAHETQTKKHRRKTNGQTKEHPASNNYAVDDNLDEEELMSPEKSQPQPKKRKSLTVARAQNSSNDEEYGSSSSEADDSPVPNLRRSNRKTQHPSYEEEEDDSENNNEPRDIASLNETWNQIYEPEPLNRTPKVGWKNPQVRTFDKKKAVVDVVNGDNYDVFLDDPTMIIHTSDSELSDNGLLKPHSLADSAELNAVVNVTVVVDSNDKSQTVVLSTESFVMEKNPTGKVPEESSV